MSMDSVDGEDAYSDLLVGYTPAEQESISVLVRVRPFLDNDYEVDEFDDAEGEPESVVNITSRTDMTVLSMDEKRKFNCSYDSILGPDVSQDDIYQEIRKCTTSVVHGFNSTIFAYGQTGSGKTFTMYGPPDEAGRRNAHQDTPYAGVIPRAVREVFALTQQAHILECSIYCSFVQIYNENLYDMLRDTNMDTPLMIREDRGKEIYVQGLSEYSVRNVSDALQLLKIAEENRTVRETYINQFSSRSHSIFQMFVEQKQVARDGGEVYLKAKYNLVDLAGSEKWNIRQEMADAHVTEMTKINLSLHTLGKCISSLASKSNGRDAHVPFRESKLTRILQDSLGGNARTCLIATVSPARQHMEETISTLKFADNAKQVMTAAVINETRPVDHEMVRKLQEEIARLRSLIKTSGMGSKPGTGNSSAGGEENVPAAIIAFEDPGQDQHVKEMKQMLDTERKRSDTLHKEVVTLKGKLRESHSEKQEAIDAAQARKQNADEIVLGLDEALGVGRLLFSLQQHRSDIFTELHSMKRVIEKFFRFELEEDQLKGKLDQNFNNFQDFKTKSLNVLPELGDTSDPRQIFQQVLSMVSTDAAANSQRMKKINEVEIVTISNHGKQREGQGTSPHKKQKDKKQKKSQKSAAVLTEGVITPQQLNQEIDNEHQQQPYVDNSSHSLSHAYNAEQDFNTNENSNSNILSSQERNEGSADLTASAPYKGKVSFSGKNVKLPAISSDHVPSTKKLYQHRVAAAAAGGGGGGDGASNINIVEGKNVPKFDNINSAIKYQQDNVVERAAVPPPKQDSQYSPTDPRRISFEQYQLEASAAALRTAVTDSSIVPIPNSNKAHKPLATNSNRSSISSVNSSKEQGNNQRRLMQMPTNMTTITTNNHSNKKNNNSGKSGKSGGPQRNNSHRKLIPAAEILEEDRYDEQEEAALQRELKAARKKLKKQQQLQEWIREKENRAASQMAAAEVEKQAMEEAELEKEKKRREYATRQKQRLRGYKMRIKNEAEKIQDLKDLGIDPESLF